MREVLPADCWVLVWGGDLRHRADQGDPVARVALAKMDFTRAVLLWHETRRELFPERRDSACSWPKAESEILHAEWQRRWDDPAYPFSRN